MLKQDTKIEDHVQISEMTNVASNVTKVKGQKKEMSKKRQKQMLKKIKDKLKEGVELDTDEEGFAIKKDLT